MTPRDDLAADLLTAVMTAQITDRRSGWGDVADRLLAAGWSRPRPLARTWVEVVVETCDGLYDFYEQGRLNGQAFCVDRDDRYWLAWDSEDGPYFQRPADEDDPEPLRKAGGVLADLDGIEPVLPLRFLLPAGDQR